MIFRALLCFALGLCLWDHVEPVVEGFESGSPPKTTNIPDQTTEQPSEWIRPEMLSYDVGTRLDTSSYSSYDCAIERPCLPGFTYNPSTCNCECIRDMTCSPGQIFSDRICLCVEATAPWIDIGRGPGPPERLRVFAVTANSIVILWSEPMHRGAYGEILWYTVYIQEDQQGAAKRTNVSSTVYAFHNRKPDTEYTIHVSASTSEGEGPNATVSVRTDVAGQGPPERLRVFKVTANYIIIKWSEPVPRGAYGEILWYTAYIEEDQGGAAERKNVSSTEYPSCNFQNRKPYTNYTIHVSANTNMGEGQNATVSVRTDVTGASEPRNLVVSSITSRSALLTWEKPLIYNRSVDSYLVKHWNVKQARDPTFESADFGQKTLTDLRPDQMYQAYVIPLTMSDRGRYVEGARSDTVAFRTLTTGTDGDNQGGRPWWNLFELLASLICGNN